MLVKTEVRKFEIVLSKIKKILKLLKNMLAKPEVRKFEIVLSKIKKVSEVEGVYYSYRNLSQENLSK